MDIPDATVVITGASSGMGRACAVRLSESGFSVFAGVRKRGDADRIRGLGIPKLQPVLLDITDPNSISAAVETVGHQVGTTGLYALVNNAGIGVTAPVEAVPLDDLRRQFEVNVFGQVAVTKAFLPSIRAAKGRIINVGSVGGKLSIPFGGLLCASKSALELLNDSLRMELASSDVQVILVAPGSIRTEAAEKLVTESETMISKFSADSKSRYEAAYRSFVKKFREEESKGVGPEVMAETVLRALTISRPKTRYPVGPKSRVLPFLSSVLPPRVLDRLLMKLFDVRNSLEKSY